VPHRDASFIGGSEERSIFTIMLYLNDEFEDGTTNFLHSHTGGRIDETIDVLLPFLTLKLSNALIRVGLSLSLCVCVCVCVCGVC
jgi:hypothetical protein